MRYFQFASVLNFTVNFKRILTSNISIPKFFFCLNCKWNCQSSNFNAKFAALKYTVDIHFLKSLCQSHCFIKKWKFKCLDRFIKILKQKEIRDDIYIYTQTIYTYMCIHTNRHIFHSKLRISKGIGQLQGFMRK